VANTRHPRLESSSVVASPKPDEVPVIMAVRMISLLDLDSIGLPNLAACEKIAGKSGENSNLRAVKLANSSEGVRGSSLFVVVRVPACNLIATHEINHRRDGGHVSLRVREIDTPSLIGGFSRTSSSASAGIRVRSPSAYR
jgi:hypothetical protein